MLTAKVLRGTAILFAGRLGSQILGLASTVIAARLLIPEDFGLVAIAMSVFSVSGALLELPVGTALIQMKVANKSDFDTAWTLNVIRGFIVALLMVLLSWPVSLIFGDPRLIGLICGLALYPAILGFRNSLFEQYIRDLSFKWEAMVELGTKLASLAAVIIVAWTTRSYWALPLGMIASGAVAVFMTFALRPEFPSFSVKEFRKFFGFSVWLGLGQIADNLWNSTTTFLLGRMLGNAVLGAYAVSAQFGERLEVLLFSPIERTLFAAFSSIQEQVARVQNAYLQSLRLCSAVVLPVCAGISLLASTVVAILFGPKFELASTALAFIAPIVAFQVLTAPGISLSIAFGRTRSIFFLRLTALIAYLPMLLVGLFYGGLTGALWAGLAGGLVLWLLSMRLISSVLGVSVFRQVSAIGRSVVACAIMIAVVYFARGWIEDTQGMITARMLMQTAAVSFLGGVIYTTTHIASWFALGKPPGIERFLLDLLASRRRASEPGPAVS